MADTKNHYDTLGVSPTADAATIKRAYYSKMRQYHPDNFIAERKRLASTGDSSRLRQLDAKIEDAKKQTQLINAAYDVLSDVDRRSVYDRMRAPRPAVQRYNPEDEPRTPRRHRPHRAPSSAPPPPPPTATPQNEKVPAILSIFLLIVLFLGLSFISNFLSAPERPRSFLLTQTSLYVPAGSMDATLTAIARRPAPTPLSLEDYARAGDAFFRIEQYRYAIEQYSHAISRSPREITLYLRRGQSFTALEQWGDALNDFEYALELDAEAIDVYRARGLLYHARWQTTQERADSRAARADFEQVVDLGGDITPEMQTALDALPE